MVRLVQFRIVHQHYCALWFTFLRSLSGYSPVQILSNSLPEPSMLCYSSSSNGMERSVTTSRWGALLISRRFVLLFERSLYAGAIFALFCCVGCYRFSSNRVISVIPRQASEYMWVTEHVGVNEAAAQHKVSIYWNGPTEEGDVEQQVVLADRAISDRNLGLILSPSNPFALNTVVQRSLVAGMSVVILSNQLSLKPEKRLSFVLNDEEEAGRLAAHRIEGALHGRGKVLIIGIDPLSSGNPDRSSAFEATLSREAPDIQIVDRLKGSFSFGQAELAAEKSIQAHPDLSAILSLNTTSTRGAVAAVGATHSSNHILIVGCDFNLDLLFILRKGILDAIIAQNMRAMGNIAVESIMAERRGLPVPAYTFVKPVLITRENIDNEAIQHMLYTDWRVRQ
jgi:ribose transport system substrate-binding protein